MEISDYIHALNDQGAMLASGADFGGLDAAVPTCPPWRTRDLLRHVGYVHRWAARYVADQVTDMMPELTEAEQLAAGPPDDQLIGWFLDGLSSLTNTLASADPATRVWTFFPAASPLTFWARRQAHETAIHCADSQHAAGLRHSYPAGFAADGIDELLMGFFGRDPVDPLAVANVGGTRILLVQAADTGDEWRVLLAEGGDKIMMTARGSSAPEAAACTLTGPASGLYLLLWNRAEPGDAGVTVSGDEQLLRAWRSGMCVTWA
jgi:uncharacterized protein (TIGR03083 family)